MSDERLPVALESDPAHLDVMRRLAWDKLLKSAEGEAKTFNDKVRRKMAFDRNPLLTQFADKIAARDYVADLVGSRYLTELYAVADQPHLVDWGRLPREYVCKVNHGSGGVIVVWEGADRTVELPAAAAKVGWTRYWIHPERAEIDRIKQLVQYWLGLDFSWWPGRTLEWAYQDVKPRLLVEELLKDKRGQLPSDYKFFVFNGTTRLIRVDKPHTDGSKSMAHFDCKWSSLPVTFSDGATYPTTHPLPERPDNLEELIHVAETLASAVDFVRVDLYKVDSRIVFGEMTNYPTAGVGVWRPEEFNIKMGSRWHQNY